MVERKIDRKKESVDANAFGVLMMIMMI